MLKKVQLKDVSQVRAGDKGDSVNIALFAPSQEVYDVFLREVTSEKVKEHFGSFIKGEVIRYEAPNILALNFLCKEALNGGGSSSLRIDALGKTYGSNLQRMYINVEENII